MSYFRVTDADLDRFLQDGYLIVEGLFDGEEAELLENISHADRALASEARDRSDVGGATSRLALRNTLSEHIFSAVVRCERVRVTMERLLGDEVYHYHHKMMMKEPLGGGAWEWHQDYGYWYSNACLYPDMASCMIAVNRAMKENGCLQVIRGSHRMGRIDHGKVGQQTGANPERVHAALERMERVYVELDPGAAVFFHSNLLHRSDANNSPHPRWTLICCYNTRHNDPYRKSGHPSYTPLEGWPDERVKEIGRRQWREMQAPAL